jgi:hypothetical protein
VAGTLRHSCLPLPSALPHSYSSAAPSGFPVFAVPTSTGGMSGPDQQSRFIAPSNNFLGNASESPSPEAAHAVGAHRDEIYILPGGVVARLSSAKAPSGKMASASAEPSRGTRMDLYIAYHFLPVSLTFATDTPHACAESDAPPTGRRQPTPAAISCQPRRSLSASGGIGRPGSLPPPSPV